jgi:hypothetical protein
MKKTIVTTLLLIIAFFTKSHGQDYPYTNLTIKQGMPSNTVYNIFADSKGYLWMSTDKGLAIYNGKTFKSFSTSNGLPDNEIFCAVEDYFGRIWLQTFNGDLCFYKDGIFHTKENTPWLRLPFNTHILTITPEADHSLTVTFTGLKNIVIINKDHLCRIDISRLSGYTEMNGENIIQLIKQGPNRYELITTDRKLWIDTLGNMIETPKLLKRHYWTASKYLAHEDGIYSTEEQFLYPVKTEGRFERMVIFNYNNSFWIGRKNGLLINPDERIIKDQFITSIARDKEGGFWIGTREHGVYHLNKNFAGIKEWHNVYKGLVKQSKVTGNTVSFVTDAEDIYQISNDSIRSFMGKRIFEKSNLDKKSSLYLINESLNALLIGIERSILLKGHQSSAITITDEVNKLKMGTLKGLIEDSNYVYVVEIGRLTRVNRNDLYNGHISGITRILNESIDNRIYAHTEDIANQAIWISRMDGVYKTSGTKLVHQPGFGKTCFREMRFFKDYLIGFTDKNRLLIVSNYNSKPFIDTIKNENCIWENIYRISDHEAIIATNNYYRLVNFYPPVNGAPAFKIQTIEDPFIPTQPEHITADSNYCYFFKEGNITRVEKNILRDKTLPPAPVISSFKTTNGVYPIRQEVNITYSESKNINIIFDNISFISEDITCQYSISSGNDKNDWQEITGNEINLNTPGYGTFVVKVRSKTTGSVYSSPATLVIHVQKPYWATWWFITISALVLLSIIWGIILVITWRRLRKKQKEHDADMKYQQSEYKALNALMNPHFIFNSLNNIQGLINKDEKRTANQFLVIFSDLIRQNMHNISKGFISLKQELTLIENYLTLEKLRFKELVNYEIIIDEEVEIEDIMIPPLMIQPLVENAVKHGLLPKQSTDSGWRSTGNVV